MLENMDALTAKLERLQARPLTEPARSLLLAELYLSYGLRSEAVELLDAIPGADETPAVQSLLGDTYWNMELAEQAEAAYARLLELAQDSAMWKRRAMLCWAWDGLLAPSAMQMGHQSFGRRRANHTRRTAVSATPRRRPKRCRRLGKLPLRSAGYSHGFTYRAAWPSGH